MFKRRKPGTDAPADNPLASRVVRGDDSPTEPLEHGDPAESEAPTRRLDIGAEAPTRILQRDTRATEAEDPPVGVLLVIEGAGCGQVLPFGHGMSAMGRAPDQRVRIDFGDARISREAHARITYDGESGRFYLQHGGGPNLTYHNGEPVLEPVTLADGDRLRLGDTTLLFRPLVGEDFDWASHLRVDD